MDWKDYFNLILYRETISGTHPYFQAELRVPSQFSLDELALRQFEYLGLPETEWKHFNVNLRKILLRTKYFRSVEFERIVQNLAERIQEEKEQLITFSTTGGGVYLLLALNDERFPFLKEKKLICYSSDFPLKILPASSPDNVLFFYRPMRGFFKHVPALWDDSVAIDLCRSHLA